MYKAPRFHKFLNVKGYTTDMQLLESWLSSWTYNFITGPRKVLNCPQLTWLRASLKDSLTFVTLYCCTQCVIHIFVLNNAPVIFALPIFLDLTIRFFPLNYFTVLWILLHHVDESPFSIGNFTSGSRAYSSLRFSYFLLKLFIHCLFVCLENWRKISFCNRDLPSLVSGKAKESAFIHTQKQEKKNIAS